jgi:hypothetical protein
LETRKAISPWFVVLFDAFALIMMGTGIAGIAMGRDLSYAAFLSITLLLVLFMHVMFWGLRRADRNYVELRPTEFRVVMFRLAGPAATIPYALVDEVQGPTVHEWWPFGYWPYTPMERFGSHVDVNLRRTKLLYLGWGRMSPWVRVIHLDVTEPEKLAEALKGRLASTGRAIEQLTSPK